MLPDKIVDSGYVARIAASSVFVAGTVWLLTAYSPVAVISAPSPESAVPGRQALKAQAKDTKAAPAAKPATKPAAAKGSEKDSENQEKPKPPVKLENVVNVTPDELVNKPHDYLGKNVKFTADFSAFSNLALDYKPALRPSKEYLSLLIKRSDSSIPLSELKLAMLIPKEKDPDTQLLAGLKEGDKIEVVGKVFSAALDDPWVEIFQLTKIGGSPDEKDQDKKAQATGADEAADSVSEIDNSEKQSSPGKAE